MGRLYGKNIRKLTALCGIVFSIGIVAVQLKSLSIIFTHFIEVDLRHAVVFSSVIIIIYSSIGGIHSVTITDVLQTMVFGTFIPLILLVAISSIGGIESLSNGYSEGYLFVPLDSMDAVYYISLFIYFIIPAMGPATFQRMLMSSSSAQMKEAFKYSAIFYLLFMFFATMIGLVLFIHIKKLEENEVIGFVIDNYILFSCMRIFVKTSAYADSSCHELNIIKYTYTHTYTHI